MLQKALKGVRSKEKQSKAKLVYTTVKVNGSTSTQKLSIIDQIRLLLSTVQDDEQRMLDTQEKVNKEALKKEASLANLIDLVIEKMRDKGEHSATILVSSVFKPHFDSVLDPVYGKGRFYNFELSDPGESLLGVEYKIRMRISEKE